MSKRSKPEEREATIKTVLDTRRVKVDGTFPVKIRVTFSRKQKYYKIALDLSVEDFNAAISPEPPRGTEEDDRIKAARKTIKKFEALATTTAGDLPFFTFDKFESKFLGKKKAPAKSQSLRQAFDAKIYSLEADDRLSSAKAYESARNSILGRDGKADLSFPDITPDFLRRYERRMLDNGASLATVGLYLRNLRSLFNEAIENQVIAAEIYPFGKGKSRYQIPTKRNPPAPLTQGELTRLFRYKPANEAEARARDLWLFSYLMNGANMHDVASLKWKNVDRYAERITFFRAKTRNTAREQKPIVARLTPPMLDIINRWGNPTGQPSDYVFTIFTKDMDAKQKRQANENARQFIRKYMQRIAAVLGIEGKRIHNYTARDSFAKAQRLAGESGDAIGEALGHENRSTTDTYLDAFEDDVKARIAANALRYLEGEANTD